MDKTAPETKPDDAAWPVWLTKRQAAAPLRKAVSEISKLSDRGYLHPVLRNGHRLFALAEVEALARPGRRSSPWLTSPSKSRNAKTPAGRRTEGEEAARVFRLLDQGMTLRQIVIRTRVPPDRVRTLYREWGRLLEQGPPADAHAFGDGPELTELATAAEQLFAQHD